jgi:hypothetical protein
VYDLVFPEQTEFHLEQLRNMDNKTFSSLTTRTFSSFGPDNKTNKDDWDFTTTEGIKAFLENNPASYLTQHRLDTNWFTCRLDGRQHGYIHARRNDGAKGMKLFRRHTWN